ncbi:MAG: hypothetical protein AAGJ08_16900 [Cyanobacteria bacterium P01_H01_bin.35]
MASSITISLPGSMLIFWPKCPIPELGLSSQIFSSVGVKFSKVDGICNISKVMENLGANFCGGFRSGIKIKTLYFIYI